MDDCVFCKIVKGQIPTERIYEDEEILVFPDAHPQAAVHWLIIPKKHVVDISQVEDQILIAIRNIALKLATDKKLSGFKLENNFGDRALVKHFHVHLMS